MTTGSVTMPFPARLRTELQIDPVLLSIVMALLLGGFVILASASISISDNAAGNPFYYLQRQLLAATIGAVAGGICLFVYIMFVTTPVWLAGLEDDLEETRDRSDRSSGNTPPAA